MTNAATLSIIHAPHEVEVRHDWARGEVGELFAMPFSDLIARAQEVHRLSFDPNRIQLSTLLSIKTGACSEDCAYCSQSARHPTDVPSQPLMDPDAVVEAARRAKDAGATRYCMGAAWRSPKDGSLDRVCEMVERVHDLEMETCATLGMLDADQARRLKDAGLDYYNHNLDTSEEFYGEVVTTRTYSDRLDTLRNVRDAGLNVCCGGIVGMGESIEDRVGLIVTLGNLPEHPESVPINMLVPMPGTPLEGATPIDPFDFVRTVAVARVVMPASTIRLSAGREQMSDELQALCFVAGANSIFVGEHLLTAPNRRLERDLDLLRRLGMKPQADPREDSEGLAAAGQTSDCDCDCGCDCGCGCDCDCDCGCGCGCGCAGPPAG